MTYISASLRRLVIERAVNGCEYCLIHQDDNFFPFEVDHVIAEKHGGETVPENLCLSCPDCNAHKGSDIGSIDRETGNLTFLFNPRSQIWAEHFRLNGAEIEPLTPEGRVTVGLLQLNHPDRLAERSAMLLLNRYPPNQ
jgi:hypothetical protein